MFGAFLKAYRRRYNDPNRGFRGDYYKQEQLIRFARKKAERLRAVGLVDYPAIVSLETLASCNAACSFCPYPSLERKGTRMPDALIAKVINDLADIPDDVFFQFAPYKVSEPFLENRLFDILELANNKLPNASISIITNGSPLTEKKVLQLGRVRNLTYVNVSMNFDNPEEYEAVMRLPFARTVERVEMLHRMHAEGVIRCPVRLTRVATNRNDDLSFIHWVRANFPRFKPEVAPRHDWIGAIDTPEGADAVPDAPCHRWFDMSITATGVVAMCCMDGSAQYPKGDVNTSHVLEIYNQPWLRELRTSLVSRRQTRSPCNGCTYLSY
jgi:hypothetical protein